MVPEPRAASEMDIMVMRSIGWHHAQPEATATMSTPKTMSVPEAGRQYFGLGRNASYDAAKRGQLPTIKIGRILRVPIVALDRMLEQVGKPDAP